MQHMTHKKYIEEKEVESESKQQAATGRVIPASRWILWTLRSIERQLVVEVYASRAQFLSLKNFLMSALNAESSAVPY